MAKLTMLKSTLTMAKPRIQVIQQSRNPEAEQRTRGRKWMNTRERWFIDHPTCAMCGRIGHAVDLDHIIPLIDGGKDDESNYQTLCRVPCHADKTAREARARGA